MRRIMFIAVAAITTLLSTPSFADSEYNAYAMLVGLKSYPTICKKPQRVEELQEAINAEAKRLGFDVTAPRNERLIALSSARFVMTSIELKKNRAGHGRTFLCRSGKDDCGIVSHAWAVMMRPHELIAHRSNLRNLTSINEATLITY